jgi:hypothetical protein
MAKTMTFSSQVLLSGEVVPYTGPTLPSLIHFLRDYNPSNPPKPLPLPRFFTFNVPSSINQSKLLKPFRIKPGSRDIVNSLIYKDGNFEKMVGGFYRMDGEFAEKDVTRQLWLLSEQTGFKIRPGSILEFLCFIRDRNFTIHDVPEISVILGNLLFSLCFTRHFFELDVVEKGKMLHPSIQVFCVQDLD